jgi:adenylate cyclase
MRALGNWALRKSASRGAIILLVAIAAGGVALLLTMGPFTRTLAAQLDDAGYDFLWQHFFRADRRRESPVVIVAANQASLTAMATGEQHWGWPWPRQFWGLGIHYLQKCGARGIGVDLLFSEPSLYNQELNDDQTFGAMLDQLKLPLVMATVVGASGQPGPFMPVAKKRPNLAAANLELGSTVREYEPIVRGTDSVARAMVEAVGEKTPEWADQPFRLHYFGSHENAQGQTAFPYVSAADLFAAAQDPDHPARHGIDPALFRDKIVLLGATAAGTFDAKASPLDALVPGVEIQATAVENLLRGERVEVVDAGTIVAITILAAVAAAAGGILPRRMWIKLLLALLIAAALVACVIALFARRQMIWLPPVAPLAAISLAFLLALAWSYFVEDREARFFLRALSQYLSPRVAAELKSDRRKLSISAEQRELTILFSDIANFTEISERLEEQVGPLLNFYLDEMSTPILKEDGIVDKYIGDAIMSFWNAPLVQPDYADRACRAALAMQRRLVEIQPRLAELGAPGLTARIGINTGRCTFGNMGSRSKFNYSIIGDPCNFASRLEGANKLYGTQILVGQRTADLVRGRFALRHVDILRVKGKRRSLAVFELLGEGPANAETAWLVERYEAALDHYRHRRWSDAETILLDVLKRLPEDGPSRALLARIATFRTQPPPDEWDGVFVAHEK